MRIEEQRQRRAQHQRGIDAVGARRGRSGNRQQHFRRRHRGEDFVEAAHLDRDRDHGDEGGEVDQDILHDRDRGRRAQAARIGERGENDEGDHQRQIVGVAGTGDAHRADDDLKADQLQRDIGHGRDNAGDAHRQRQPAIAVAAAHEIARGDVVVLVADVPEPRKHQEQDRIDQDRIGHGEEGDGAGAEGERRNGDESVGRIDVAADQEPGDERAEAPPAEAPFVQQIEVARAPFRGGEAEPGDEGEQQDEDGQSGPIHVSHGITPRMSFCFVSVFFRCAARARIAYVVRATLRS